MRVYVCAFVVPPGAAGCGLLHKVWVVDALYSGVLPHLWSGGPGGTWQGLAGSLADAGGSSFAVQAGVVGILNSAEW